MPTREIYRIRENGTREYSGYARFGDEGEYEGSFGGYGLNGNQNNPNNGASRVQNYINTVQARVSRRNPAYRNYRRSRRR